MRDKWESWLRSLAEWRPGPPSAEEQWQAYLTARKAAEDGTGTVEALRESITLVVAERITAEEDAARKQAVIDAARARRERWAAPARLIGEALTGFPVDAVIGALLALVYLGVFLFVIFLAWTVATMPTGYSQQASAAPPPPALHVVHTGTCTLVIETPKGPRAIHVVDVAEDTNGAETELPIRYITEDGKQHVYRGMFWVVDQGIAVPAGLGS